MWRGWWGTHAGSGLYRPWLDVYHLKSSQRWEHTGSSWQQQQTQEQQSHHLQMLLGGVGVGKKEEKKKLKISAINIQSLMCVISRCFGSEMGGDGKQQCCLLLAPWVPRSHAASQWKNSEFWANKPSCCFDEFKECACKSRSLSEVSGGTGVRERRPRFSQCSAGKKKLSREFWQSQPATSVYSTFSIWKANPECSGEVSGSISWNHKKELLDGEKKKK